MSGFVQPQWSGFSQRPATPSGTGDESPQPTGIEIERRTLGRGPIVVTPASPRPHKALIPGSRTP